MRWVREQEPERRLAAHRLGSSGAEMIEGRRQRIECAALLVGHDEAGTLLDVADGRERETELHGQCVQARRGARRGREAELVVVTAGEQALEREPALGAGETTIQRVRARDPRELDGS